MATLVGHRAVKVSDVFTTLSTGNSEREEFGTVGNPSYSQVVALFINVIRVLLEKYSLSFFVRAAFSRRSA